MNPKDLNSKIWSRRVAFLKVRIGVSQRRCLFKFRGFQAPNFVLGCDGPFKGRAYGTTPHCRATLAIPRHDAASDAVQIIS